MNAQLLTVLIIVLVIWNITLTFFIFRFYLYYSRVTKNGKKESLIKLLDQILEDQSTVKKVLDVLHSKYVTLESNGLLYIQKVGLLRFNPFKDTGGDQSFILALVDAQNTGVIISSLHTRTGTRWYAKHVIKGKGAEYELSKEEEEALKNARSQTNLKHVKE